MANHTLQTRKAVTNLLKTASGLPTFYRLAPASQEFPFVVFLLDELSHNDDIYLMDVTVDVCYYGTDDTEIETKANAIQALDFTYYMDDDIEFRMYHETRNIVEESDKQILRRRLSFSIRLTERGN